MLPGIKELRTPPGTVDDLSSNSDLASSPCQAGIPSSLRAGRLQKLLVVSSQPSAKPHLLRWDGSHRGHH